MIKTSILVIFILCLFYPSFFNLSIIIRSKRWKPGEPIPDVTHFSKYWMHFLIPGFFALLTGIMLLSIK